MRLLEIFVCIGLLLMLAVVLGLVHKPASVQKIAVIKYDAGGSIECRLGIEYYSHNDTFACIRDRAHTDMIPRRIVGEVRVETQQVK